MKKTQFYISIKGSFRLLCRFLKIGDLPWLPLIVFCGKLRTHRWLALPSVARRGFHAVGVEKTVSKEGAHWGSVDRADQALKTKIDHIVTVCQLYCVQQALAPYLSGDLYPKHSMCGVYAYIDPSNH